MPNRIKTLSEGLFSVCPAVRKGCNKNAECLTTCLRCAKARNTSKPWTGRCALVDWGGCCPRPWFGQGESEGESQQADSWRSARCASCPSPAPASGTMRAQPRVFTS
ncbi:hypothetical protein SRHO_G00147890 [Serrasalmus rhombeus]